MRKFTICLFLYLGLISYSYANESCSNFLDFSWSTSSNQATFTLKSTSPKSIWITKFTIFTKSGNEMKSFTRNSRKYGTTSQFVLYLDRYGTNSHTVSISNLNPDLMKNAQANYVCTFIQPERRKVQNLNTKKDKNWFKWWYLLFILPALGVLNGIIEEFKNKSNNKKTKSSIKKIKSSEKVHPGNIIEDIWDGKKSLGETYWLYFILINGIISFGSAYFAELNSNNFYYIPGLASNIITMVGVWNSSTLYQLKKIKEKQPYGWAYAAKVSVVLNGLSIAATAVQVFNL